ncbi:aminotransferase class V-fold PLP-dependent enzyme [Zemynaea arenosa]|uniref:aminotransferase class V-fold PLP-dependent enzyme n=1 Tax=Zemynaea arenosa TaxID=2561931 RepID=UPI00143182B2|nr:aminotransferase class V-fold PLP-dependent enzyme [Massilia arenosa]
MPRQAGLIAPDDESYWAQIAAQYDVSPSFLNLENGYFGVQARPVFEAFQRYERTVNRDNSFFLRREWPGRHAHVLKRLAAFAGVDEGELLITRNLMESLNIILQGYPWRAGDEVVCASHDYDEVAETLEMVAQRRGLRVARVEVPLNPSGDDEIVAVYEGALSEHTRAILITHMVHRTGQIMPVARLSALARSRGVDTIVDAAHSFAQLDFRLPDLGADFVGANLHKWLGAPLGVGLLYVKRERLGEIAPLFGSMAHADGGIARLGNVGTVPPAPVLAIEDALDFHESIGSASKEARLRYLTQYWVARVRGLPGLRMLTPSDPQRSCAIAVFAIDGLPAQQVCDRLLEEYGIFTVVRPVAGTHGVRVTPHLYITPSDLDRLVAALQAMTRETQ